MEGEKQKKRETKIKRETERQKIERDGQGMNNRQKEIEKEVERQTYRNKELPWHGVTNTYILCLSVCLFTCM